jgi:hypothetical protein
MNINDYYFLILKIKSKQSNHVAKPIILCGIKHDWLINALDNVQWEVFKVLNSNERIFLLVIKNITQ